MDIEKKYKNAGHLRESNERISVSNEWKSLSEYLIFLRHKKAYLYASSFCNNKKKVLDYGCGNGYGSFLLAEHSLQVKAVDIYQEVISACQKKYKRSNLSFQIVKPGRIQFKDNFFDIVVSLQVIEHVHDVSAYLSELKRVLKKDGLLIITTPNRKYRLYPFQRPKNPYHLREYSLRQLKKQLCRYFKHVKILGICGDEEIYNIECKRVKKSVIYFFLPPILKSKLKLILYKLLGKESSIFPYKKSVIPIEKEVLDRYSLEDFTVLDENVEKSLDFLAIMKKN